MTPPRRTETRCVAAIDPGSAKCGLAIVQEDGIVTFRAIVPTPNLLTEVTACLTKYQPQVLLIGGGTGSRSLLAALKSTPLPASLEVVDEAYTSEAARARYLAENPPRGLQRLLPPSLRCPEKPYDDYVAVILAERYWQKKAGNSEV